MELSDYLVSFLVQLASNAPVLLFWIAVIVIAAAWLKRGGGKAERFIIAGAAIKITGNLLTIPLSFMHLWLRAAGYDLDFITGITSAYGIFLNVISMAGIICLIYAFWVKFSEKNNGAALEAAA